MRSFRLFRWHRVDEEQELAFDRVYVLDSYDAQNSIGGFDSLSLLLYNDGSLFLPSALKDVRDDHRTDGGPQGTVLPDANIASLPFCSSLLILRVSL